MPDAVTIKIIMETHQNIVYWRTVPYNVATLKS